MFASFQTGVFLLVAILVYQEIAISGVSEHGSQYRKTRVVFKWCFLSLLICQLLNPSFYRQGWLMILWYRTCKCQFWGIHWCFFPRFIWYRCVNWFCCRVPSLVRNRGQDGHLHQCICYWFLRSGFLSLHFILFIVRLRRLISRLV